MAFPSIPAKTRAAQHQASNPNHSAWVSANAGSGKTHVLANRVVRLLLHGAAPSKILCLTFTKAAAANMAGRVFTTLAQWTQLADAELAAEIEESGAPRPDEAGLACARKLFARAAETPGGLKIQTIHAFCERLLHLFPFEANVPASFEVPDELAQLQLLQRAQRDVLAKASLDKGALGKALQRLSDECGPAGFGGLVKEATRLNVVSRADLRKEPAEVLGRLLGLGRNRGIGSIEREIIEEGISPSRWSSIADTLEGGSPKDEKCGKKFRQAFLDYQKLTSGGTSDSVSNTYRSIFLTEKHEARDSIVTKSFARAHPGVAHDLQTEQKRLELLCAERKAAATVERTRALMTLAAAVSKRYAAEKAARGFLDFDDLIAKTSTLLQHSDARWVLYKLDAGIDHILVDEAQDTSESQWRILADLTSEFSAGEGAGPASRTFFAVGDEKQSIFSFQGAAPKMFGKMGKKLERQFTAAAKPFLRVPLASSFRSVPAILYAVDKIFDYPGHKSGLTDGEWMKHESLKGTLPGIVELWPLLSTPATEVFGGWTLPDEFPDAQDTATQDPANSVALRVAQKIALLLNPESKEIVYDSGTHGPQAVRARDILILVRKRGPFFEAMIRALKKSAIPVAGADRLDLTDHIAVKDLIAAGRAALLPQDDLTLACVLKSPLIGLDDDDLLQLAPTRTGSLFGALDSSVNSKHTAAAAKLAAWQARAGGGAFAFYSALLSAEGGRRAIEARLGLEACDAIDEFLRLTIAHDENGAPSLAAFLHSLEGIEYSIKRDMETSADMVRVMTVHAAKGLEAKIVFLPDACDVPSPRHLPNVFSLAADVPGEDAIAWSPKKDLDCEKVAAAREKAGSAARDEYRRLLYVALTRAEERLYIAGFHGTKDPDSGCWYKMIEAALGSGDDFEEVPAFWDSAEKVRRFASPASGVLVGRAPDAEAAAQPPLPPDWLFRKAPIDENAAPVLTPSHALAAANPKHHRQALQRGRAMHLLLQYLPLLAPEKRECAAAAFLAARAPFLDETARLKLAADARALLALPELAPLFGPRSRPEVLVAGKVTVGQRTFDVVGQVDRIGETEDEIFVADYKTGAPCPLERTPAAYLVQMALYRAVLAPLWPKKHLAMALIWTASPAAVWLPGAFLDAALESLVAQ